MGSRPPPGFGRCNFSGRLAVRQPRSDSVPDATHAAHAATGSQPLRQTRHELREAEALLQLSLEAGRIGTFRHDFTTGMVQCGPVARAMYGLPRGDVPLTVEQWFAPLLPEDLRRLEEGIRKAVAERSPRMGSDYRIRHLEDGSLRHFESRVRLDYDAKGQLLTALGVVIDVTQIREAEALQRLCLKAGRVGTYRHNHLTGMVEFSRETQVMFGMPEGDGQIAYADWLAPVVPEDFERVQLEIRTALAAREAETSFKVRVRRPSDGAVRHVEVRTDFSYDTDGRPVSSVGAIIDVTESRETEARIAHLAYHDDLTGLPNRRLFAERLEDALARANRGECFALLMVDLDHFKAVNDVFGHPVGDALLLAATARLQSELREIDTLARLGGDEFAIIQSGIRKPQDAIVLAERLVDALGAPFDLEGRRVVVGTSIGISLAPADGPGSAALIRSADNALYRAKAEGRGGWRLFTPVPEEALLP